MGELIKCPLCGGTHPEGTTRCDVMWADIPNEPEDDSVVDNAEVDSSSDEIEDQRNGRCPACGAFGAPGEECWQCGSIIESCEKEACGSRVVLRIESGASIPVELDRTIVVGREGDLQDISDALAGYDIVSRKHCSIRLSQDATLVTVTDNGSKNGTFVGPDAERLEKDVACTMKLPARIRLGSCVNVTLESEV